ncbi:MAG: DNA-binding response OmpR family regulator [Reinekea sp.]|jgi:DNA-binding response OmpR family regulator
MSVRILIVEDEPELAELIALYCENAGWQSIVCGSAEEALGALKVASFALITLDINLPGIDGFEFLAKIRLQTQAPVVIVSARESDGEIINGLELGADEYVTKPFAPKVLIARMSALLRRQESRVPNKEQFNFGTLVLEPDAFAVKNGAERINLSTREFDILLALVQANGTPVNTYELLEKVWGSQTTETSAVGVYIQRLRKKLESIPGNQGLIETVHGRGYCINSQRHGGEPE